MSSNDYSDKLKRLNPGMVPGVVKGSALLSNPAPEPELPDMSRFIPGEVRTVDEGSCFVTDEWFPFTDTFGNYPLERLGRINMDMTRRLFGLEPFLDDPAANRMIFLDTETTGLAGGTGTYAFMIGVGWIEDEGFRVQQFFMRDYDEEPAQVRVLADLLKQCGLMVTYNGASFDVPLLRTRFVFNRIRMSLSDIPHLDLLPVARRLWKPRYGAANLSFLENKVLGNEREGDVPGALIPTLYFQFIRGASPRTLAPVFYHNRMDIVALAALTERAVACHLDPDCIEDLWERLGVARFLAARGLEEEAFGVLSFASNQQCGSVAWHLCLRTQAVILKRRRRLDEASALWRRLQSESHFDPFVWIELAKHCEHVERNHNEAQRLVLEVFEKYSREPTTPSEEDSAPEEDEEIRYDYSEWKPARRERLAEIYLDRDEDDIAPSSDGALPLPRWTERFEQELNHRLRRLIRKLGG